MAKPGFYEFEGMHPSGKGVAVFRIAKDGVLEHFKKTGNSSMYLDAILIPGVVSTPAAVFEDLKRPGQEKSLCYCGMPDEKFRNDTHLSLPPPPGKTFVVFCTSDFKILKWGWEDEDEDMSGYPSGHQARFGRKLWPTD